METLENKMKVLKANQKLQREALELDHVIETKLGLNSMYVEGTHTLVFKSERKYSKDKGLKSMEDVRAIIDFFPPIHTNAELGFAGKSPIETQSPFLLSINNYTHYHEPEAQLRYVTEVGGTGMTIRVDMNPSIVDFHASNRKVAPNSQASSPEMFKHYCLDKTYGFQVQNYGTSSPSTTHFTYHGNTKAFDRFFNQEPLEG